MPIIIGAVIAGGLIVNGIATISANKREKELANQLAEELNDQKDLLQDRANLMMDELEGLRAGDIPIPIERVDPEDIKMPKTAYDALDEARSDEAMKNYMEGADAAMATAIAGSSSDPRLKAYASAKATQQYKQGVKQTASELAKDDTEALLSVGNMEASINAKNAAAQNAADQQYANFKNQYLQAKEDALQKFIFDAQDQGFDLGYQATAMPLQAQVTNAARTAQLGGDISSAGVSAAGAGVDFGTGGEEGGRVKTLAEGGGNYLGDFMKSSQATSEALYRSRDFMRLAMDEIQKPSNDPAPDPDDEEGKNDGDAPDPSNTGGETDAATSAPEIPEGKGGGKIDALINLEYFLNSGGKFMEDGGRVTRYLSKEDGGMVDRTRGEFNHGDPNKPETGNDQVLIDQEDLKSGLDSGQITSYEDIENNDMVQAVTTGDELIFNDEMSSMIENLTLKSMGGEENLYASQGRRNKPRTKEEIDAALKLADYMGSLLAKPQFRK